MRLKAIFRSDQIISEPSRVQEEGYAITFGILKHVIVHGVRVGLGFESYIHN